MRWATTLGHGHREVARQLQKDDPENHAAIDENRRAAIDALEDALLTMEDNANALRRHTLLYLARLCFDVGDSKKASDYATRMLKMAEGESQAVLSGELHKGHLILGRLALRSGDVEQARSRLLSAGESGGWSPFGTDMSLARELLANGDRQVVSDYLQLCGSNRRAIGIARSSTNGPARSRPAKSPTLARIEY